MWCLNAAVVVLLASFVSSRAIPATHVVHESRDVPRERVKFLEPEEWIDIRISLSQNPEAMKMAESWLLDVSHPESQFYGRFWSQSEVDAAFAPSQDTVDTVTAWLASDGIDIDRIHVSDNRAWMTLQVTAEEAKTLLHARYYTFGDEHSSVACDEYYVPRHIQKHVEFIVPGVKSSTFSSVRADKRSSAAARKPTRDESQSLPDFGRRGSPVWTPVSGDWALPDSESNLSNCSNLMSPACIKALYDIPVQNSHAAVSTSNRMGIIQWDYYDVLDLNSLFHTFAPNIPNGTMPILEGINGGYAPAPPAYAGGEAVLDFSISIPIIFPQKTIDFQMINYHYADNGTGSFNTFIDALDASYCNYTAYGETGDLPPYDPTYPDPKGYNHTQQCGVYRPTNVISISYGGQEPDLPVAYQKHQCQGFLKLGLLGVSVFLASGDHGVGAFPGDEGVANGCLRNGTVFSPTEPNSCPYITNVGGTQLYPGQSVTHAESSYDTFIGGYNYASGGGFSNIYAIPKYQKDAISTYFKEAGTQYPFYTDGNYNSSKGVYNRYGRGIPDVAANAVNTAVYYQGVLGLSGGTSAAAPTFASVVNRIIEERIKAGKGPLGFINPALYAHPEMLNDITNGTNPGCGTKGFRTAKGWDPVTGLGTPNYPRMLEYFMSLP